MASVHIITIIWVVRLSSRLSMFTSIRINCASNRHNQWCGNTGHNTREWIRTVAWRYRLQLPPWVNSNKDCSDSQIHTYTLLVGCSMHLIGLLQPHIGLMGTYVDLTRFVEKFKNNEVRPDEILVSFHIVSLFTMVPSQETLEHTNKPFPVQIATFFRQVLTMMYSVEWVLLWADRWSCHGVLWALWLKISTWKNLKRWH